MGGKFSNLNHFKVNKLDPESESPETQRLGRIYLHRLDLVADNSVEVVSRLDCPAVLDMKWNKKEPILGKPVNVDFEYRYP